MGTNVATLKVVGTSDLTQVSRDFKSIATEAKSAATPIAAMNKSLDQSTKSATSFGQKVKSLGSNFSSSIASIGTLGGTVLNLSRQYQDLGDSQIAVDKAQLKVSKTTEATGTATKKLNDLVAKGVTSGAEYEQALLDVKQAQEAQSLATQMLTEKEEDHQRAQENFWIGLVPTVTSAGGSVMQVLKDMGGTKGFGGLKTAITSLGGKGAGLISGLVSGLAGIGGAASGSVGGLGAMTGATTGLGTAMKGLALSSLPVAIAIAGIALAAKASSLVIHEVVSLIKGDTLEAVTSLEGLIGLLDTISQVIGPAGAGFAALSNLKFAGIGSLKDQVAKLKAELQNVPQTVVPASASLEKMDQGAQSLNGIIDSLVGGVLGFTKKAEAVPAPANAAAGAIGGIGTAATTAAPAVEGLSGSFATITKSVDGYSTAFATVTAQTDPFNASVVIATQKIAAENSELNLLVKAANAGAKASQNMSRRQQELASVLAKATQNMQKQIQVSATGYRYNLPGTGGGFHTVTRNGKTTKVPGSQPVMGGQPGVGYRTGGSATYNAKTGQWMMPKKKHAAMGMHETVNQPTWILAGEAGRERVDIGKPGSGGGGGINIQVFVDGVERPARYSLGTRK